MRTDSLSTALATAYYRMIFEGKQPKSVLYAFYRARLMALKWADELVLTYETIDRCLTCKDVDQIIDIIPELKKLADLQRPFQPEVIDAFKFLYNIAIDIRRLSHDTSQLSRQDRGALALGKLNNELKKQAYDLPEPERRYFLEIVSHWREVVIREIYEIAKRRMLKPIENPYPVGPPVKGGAFKGREEIFREIKSHWNKKQGSLVPILLYGHRRMGKTSIGMNLKEKLGKNYIVIYSSAQGYSSSEIEFLRYIARAFRYEMGVNIPTLESFKESPRSRFDEVIESAKRSRNDKIVILVIDEFEAIEDSLRERKLSSDFLNYLYSVSQRNSEWLGLMLISAHSLEEMARESWGPFGESIKAIKVEYMKYDDAKNLIENPTKDFPVNYDPKIVDRIIQVTGGQPFLINEICHEMIEELNRRIEIEELTDYPILDTDYLKVALNKVAHNRGDYYFHALWFQMSEDERDALRVLSNLMLKKLGIEAEEFLQKVSSEMGSDDAIQPCVKLDEILTEMGWERGKLESVLQKLNSRGVIKPMDGKCDPLKSCNIDSSKNAKIPTKACLCFCVALMIPWVSITKPWIF